MGRGAALSENQRAVIWRTYSYHAKQSPILNVDVIFAVIDIFMLDTFINLLILLVMVNKMNNAVTELLHYIISNDNEKVCQILSEKPELLLKIPMEMRKEKYIVTAVSERYGLFEELEENEKTADLYHAVIKNVNHQGLPSLIHYLPSYIKTEEILLWMIDRKGYCIEYIDNPTEEMCMRAVLSNPYAIYYIKNPTEEMLLIAIKNGNGVIFSVKNPTEGQMIAAMKTQGLYNLYRRMPQYYNAVLEYMKKYGASLKHIQRKLKTYEICKAAIGSSPHAIKHVNKSTLRKHPDLVELDATTWEKK